MTQTLRTSCHHHLPIQDAVEKRSEQWSDGWALAVAGFASIQALTSMTSDGRPLVEDVEDGKVSF
jgi:hypothetical protein